MHIHAVYPDFPVVYSQALYNQHTYNANKHSKQVCLMI